MNKRGVKVILLSGTLLATSLGLGNFSSFANENNSKDNLIKTYSHILSDETKQNLEDGNYTLEEEKDGNITTLTLNDENGETITKTEIKTITTEEAIQNLMKSENLSYEEAKASIDSEVLKVQQRYSLTRSQAEKSTEWQTISNDKTYIYAGFRNVARLSGDFLLYRNGTFRQINGLKSVFHRIISSSSGRLESVNARPMTTKFPTMSASMRSDAVFALTTSYSIALQLQKEGFSISGSASGSWTARKEIIHAYTYRI